MEWWMIGIGVAVVIVVILIIYYSSDEGNENSIEKFSELIDEGKLSKVKKKAKDPMEVYEAVQHSANKATREEED